MKTFIVAMVIFLVMLVGTECYINWLDSVSEELAQQTAVMHDVVARDDWSACQEKMASFFKQWNQVYPRLEFFIHHKEIDTINNLLYELDGYVKVQDKDGFLVRNGVLQNLLLLLPTGERLNWENILCTEKVNFT